MFITATITIVVRIATIKKITDNFKSIRIAITIAPITRNGERVASLINILTPFCTVFESLVRRLTSDAVPTLSILLYDNEFICL